MTTILLETLQWRTPITRDTVNFPFSLAHLLRSQGSPTFYIAGPIQGDMAPVESRGSAPRTGGGASRNYLDN